MTTAQATARETAGATGGDIGAKNARKEKVRRLRAATAILEKISNLKAPLKSNAHPFDVHRRDYLGVVKRALVILGCESDVKETPASEAELDEVLSVCRTQLKAAMDKPYADVHDIVQAWLEGK